MKVRKLQNLTQIDIVPNAEGTEFGLILQSHENGSPIATEVPFSAEGLMRLLHGLQSIQAIHKIPIPPNLRPSGKPTLVVIDDSSSGCSQDKDRYKDR